MRTKTDLKGNIFFYMTNVTQMNETERQYYFLWRKPPGHVAKLEKSWAESRPAA